MSTPAAQNPPALDGLLTRELEVRTDSFDEATRSVEAVITTEAPVPTLDRARRELVDEVLVADGFQFREHLPLLNNHRRGDVLDVLGHVADVRQEGDAWVGRVYVATGGEDSAQEHLFRNLRDGHHRGFSIGYVPQEMTRVAPGQTVRVGERTFTAGDRPMRVAARTQAFEVSAAPVGADERALARALADGETNPDDRTTPTPPWRGFR